MRYHAKRKTTENVIRAKKRREENRILKCQAETKEAERLGITIPELRAKKFAEVQKIIKDQERPAVRTVAYEAPYRRYLPVRQLFN